MADYWVAAEGKIRIPGGRMTDAKVGPAGLMHAVGEDNRVLCGTRLSSLEQFRDMRFDNLSKGVARCPDCLRARRG